LYPASRFAAIVSAPATFTRGCRRATFQLPTPRQPGDNRTVHDATSSSDNLLGSPFQRGAMVVVTLGNPREKFWGAILALSAEGLSVSGVELPSFDDLIAIIKEGEPFTPSVVFFPMHRVERLELDLPEGAISSLAQRFAAKTGLDPAAVLTRASIHLSPERS
jgi:hypothetical protein